MSAETEIDRHRLPLLKERDRYRAALVDLAGDCRGAAVDPSEHPKGTACRDLRPDDSAEWCYACVASAALEPES